MKYKGRIIVHGDEVGPDWPYPKEPEWEEHMTEDERNAVLEEVAEMFARRAMFSSFKHKQQWWTEDAEIVRALKRTPAPEKTMAEMMQGGTCQECGCRTGGGDFCYEHKPYMVYPQKDGTFISDQHGRKRITLEAPPTNAPEKAAEGVDLVRIAKEWRDMFGVTHPDIIAMSTEIERLRKKVVNLNMRECGLQRMYEEQSDALRTEVFMLSNKLWSAEEEIKQLQSSNARMRKALEDLPHAIDCVAPFKECTCGKKALKES